MSKTLLDKKREVIKKFYGGERKSYYHKFNENTGICEYCGKFIGDEKKSRMCDIITPDEINYFNNPL